MRGDGNAIWRGTVIQEAWVHLMARSLSPWTECCFTAKMHVCRFFLVVGAGATLL